ncbi:MAG: hypothetical protein HC861_05395 [Rhodospirillaceae bacterium]|nr:hypothetical protein [Rhodospirillaceae bacterium]
MIRSAARAGVDPGAQQRLAWAAIDPVEVEDRPPRREGLLHRVRRDQRGEARSHPPVPVVEIAHHQQAAGQGARIGAGVAAHQRLEDVELRPDLVGPEAEMRGDHADIAERAFDRGLDGAAGLAPRDVQLVDIDVVHRPAADQDMAVVAVRRDDGAGLGGMAAQHLLERGQRQVGLVPAARIHFLQRDDVRVVRPDRFMMRSRS